MNFLNSCLIQVEGLDISDSSKDGLRGGLQNLKQVSKGAALRELIDQYASDQRKDFKELYEYRGRVAHPTSRESRQEVDRMAYRAKRLAGTIVAEYIKQHL